MKKGITIGIDARIPKEDKTGIPYVLHNIIPEMIALAPENQYKMFGRGLDFALPQVKPYHLNKLFIKGLTFLWRYIWWPSSGWFMGKTDAFLYTNFYYFPARTKKKVLMIYDLAYIFYPQFAEKRNGPLLRRLVPKAIKKVDAIVTISQNIKKEIIDYYKVNPEKVHVIDLGCPDNVYRVEDQAKIVEAKKKYGIGKKYVLFVGTLQPRKNIEGAIRSYSLLAENLKNEYELVVVGKKGWRYQEIFKLAKECGVGNNVIFTGYVDENDISAIYSGATLFFFPAFYEGFGLPLLEAMVCAVPIVSSNNATLMEVGQDAVEYVNPHSVEDMRRGLALVLTDEKYAQELVEKGLIRKDHYSWEKAAQQLLDTLQCS